jgi:peptide deformylase
MDTEGYESGIFTVFWYIGAMCKIVQEPHKALRATAQEISVSDITGPAIQKTIADMKKALHREPDGVAIAAPQIGESVRMFIIAGFVFDLKKKNVGGTPSPDRVFINPVLSKLSKETQWIEGEGCLSVRWIYGTAKRHKKATVTAYDEKGKKFSLDGSGLLAQIFQHEVDHLNGILFIDHAKDIRPMTEQEIVDYQEDLRQIELNHAAMRKAAEA